MPDEIDGNNPPRNTDSGSLSPSPFDPTMEQRIVALETQNNARKDAPMSNEFANEVKMRERILIAINGFALLATIGIGIIYIFQLKAMRESNTLTRNALKSAAQSSLDSSNQFQVQLHHFDAGLGVNGLQIGKMEEGNKQSRNLASTSRDALVSVQRAFIFATGLDAARILDPNDPTKIGSMEFSITWENNGTTPTRQMATYFNWITTAATLSENFSYPDVGNAVPTPLALGPKSVAHTTAIQLPAADISRIIAHQEHFYIWGWARYRDIFPHTKEHITRFCVEVTGFQGNPLSMTETSRPAMVNCPNNNCYDDECKVK